MEFEWDEAKRQSNLKKHKIDFAEAVTIYDDFVYMYQDTRADYGEERYVTIGLLYEGMEIAVIHTPRGEKYRIISARRARRTERKKYYDEKRRNEK